MNTAVAMHLEDDQPEEALPGDDHPPEKPFEFKKDDGWSYKTRCRPRTKPGQEEKFVWTRSETLALAAHACVHCDGLGMAQSRGQDVPCKCVLRAIFRACLARFRSCAAKEKFLSRVTLDAVQGADRKHNWSRKDEEFSADFCLVSRRSLTEQQYRIFKYHFLLGAEWQICCRKFNIDRGTFFHEVYRIQQKLGRVFRELQPYCLYPVSEYFYGASKLSPK